MNFPVTPYFFKKLSIYERIRNGDRLTAKKLTWFGEVILLKWAAEEHEHLYSVLSAKRAFKIIKNKIPEKDFFLKELKKGEKIEYEDPKEMVKKFYALSHLRKVLGNLHQRGLAKIISFDQKKEPDTIRFNEKGRMWGDVLLDIDEGKEFKYSFWLKIIKFAFILFLLTVIISGLRILIETFLPIILDFTPIKCSILS